MSVLRASARAAALRRASSAPAAASRAASLARSAAWIESWFGPGVLTGGVAVTGTGVVSGFFLQPVTVTRAIARAAAERMDTGMMILRRVGVGESFLIAI